MEDNVTEQLKAALWCYQLAVELGWVYTAGGSADPTAWKGQPVFHLAVPGALILVRADPFSVSALIKHYAKQLGKKVATEMLDLVATTGAVNQF